MPRSILKGALVLALPFVVAGCVSSSDDTPATPTPAVVVATQGGTIGAGGLRQFPDSISGGDGFQANPTNDASFATLINAVRADAGSAPLTFNAQLNNAAQAHSDDMLAQNYFSHTGLNGSSIGDRAKAAGYNFTTLGENIAQGQTNENQAMNGWVTSPGHQANNINPAFKEFGLGRAGAGGNTRWTLMLGAQ